MRFVSARLSPPTDLNKRLLGKYLKAKQAGPIKSRKAAVAATSVGGGREEEGRTGGDGSCWNESGRRCRQHLSILETRA